MPMEIIQLQKYVVYGHANGDSKVTDVKFKNMPL
jgi:hypothetical protein